MSKQRLFNDLSAAALAVCLAAVLVWAAPSAAALSVTDFGSIQEALDANPGRMIHVPPGDYEISERIRIQHPGSGLYGYGRIIQTTPTENVISIEQVENVRVCDVTLTRPDDKPGKVSALIADRCRNLTLRNLQVLNTRAPAGAINLSHCEVSQVLGCLVQNYATVSIEDRTDNERYGYAYKSIDGTGIQVQGTGILIQGNRVIQTELHPTEETQKQYELGVFVNKQAEKGALIDAKSWEEGYTKNWNQGAAIHVGDPKNTRCVQVLGNYVQNGAQAVDIHADQVILADNITNNAFLGMKAMHGSRNVIILGNQFSECDIHGVLLQPGVASHPAGAPEHEGDIADANVDGGHIVANNIISDFGYGDANWIWGNDRYPFEFMTGQTPEDPPLQDVIVMGNIIYDRGRDGILVEDDVQVPAPRYKAAVGVFEDNAEGLKGPKNLLFSDNILHPGTEGVSMPADLNLNTNSNGEKP